MFKYCFIYLFIVQVTIFSQKVEQSKIPLFDGSNNNLVHINGGKFKKYNYAQNEVIGSNDIFIREFYITQYEITAGDYKQYCDENGLSMPLNQWENTRVWKNDYPIMNVSWDEATNFCNWLGNKINKTVRLPSEVEWEYVASSGVREKIYPWGNTVKLGRFLGNVADKSLMNYLINKWGNYDGYNFIADYDDGFGVLAPVGSYEPNEFGLYDISGNVSEFVADDYNAKLKVTKGSNAFSCKGNDFSITSRKGSVKNPPCYGIGFRVVVEK